MQLTSGSFKESTSSLDGTDAYKMYVTLSMRKQSETHE